MCSVEYFTLLGLGKSLIGKLAIVLIQLFILLAYFVTAFFQRAVAGSLKALSVKAPSPGKLFSTYSGELLTGVLVLMAFLVITLAVLFASRVFRKEFKGAFHDIALSFLAVVYIGFGFGSLLLMRLLGAKGSYLILYAFIVVWLTDSFALFSGKLFGKHKLGITASPNKTVEGTIGGIIFALLGAFVLKRLFPGIYAGSAIFSLPVFLTVTFCISLAVQFGDLVESVLKRSGGVKDSSSLVPGHGGFLDVFDAQIFISPLVFLIFAFFS